MDRIVLEELDGARRRRCVNCGHTDTMISGTVVEPPTRLTNLPRQRVPETAVRIVDPQREQNSDDH